MALFKIVDCVHCGCQTMIDIHVPGDTCLFCDKPALRQFRIKEKKEDIMETPTQPNPEVPPRPKKRKQLPAYYEENKEAIIAAYRTLGTRQFLKVWHISTKRWMQLRKDWKEPSKGTGNRYGLSKKVEKGDKKLSSQEKVKPEEGEVDVSLSQRDQYLILIGYQQATRECLKMLSK